MRWRFRGGELDVGRRELRVGGRLRRLQPRFFDVLAYLLAHRDRVVGKEELLGALWPDAVVTDGSLQRALSLALRAPELVRTHARRGYRFVGEAVELEADPADAALVHVPVRLDGDEPRPGRQVAQVGDGTSRSSASSSAVLLASSSSLPSSDKAHAVSWISARASSRSSRRGRGRTYGTTISIPGPVVTRTRSRAA